MLEKSNKRGALMLKVDAITFLAAKQSLPMPQE